MSARLGDGSAWRVRRPDVTLSEPDNEGVDETCESPWNTAASCD